MFITVHHLCLRFSVGFKGFTYTHPFISFIFSLGGDLAEKTLETIRILITFIASPRQQPELWKNPAKKHCAGSLEVEVDFHYLALP